MLEQMDRMYPGEYQIFEAVKNKKGSIGISMSFKRIIEENYDEPEIHIIEDDIKFTSENSRVYFEEQYKKLPEDWQIYLGGSYTHLVDEKLSGLLKIRDYRTFNSLVIRKSAYDHILSHDVATHENIDHWVSTKIKHAYLCYPMVAIEHSGYSYNAGRKVDYSGHLKNKEILK